MGYAVLGFGVGMVYYHTHTPVYTCVHARTHANTYTYTHTHTCTHAHTHTHTCNHMHVHNHRRWCGCTRCQWTHLKVLRAVTRSRTGALEQRRRKKVRDYQVSESEFLCSSPSELHVLLVVLVSLFTGERRIYTKVNCNKGISC